MPKNDIINTDLLQEIEIQRQWINEDIAFRMQQLQILDRIEAEIISKQGELQFE